MSTERYPRIFVAWPNGAFLNSDGGDFQETLLELVAQFGAPTIVEYREVYEGKALCADCVESDGPLCDDCAKG